MFDDPIASAVVSLLFAVFFGAYVFDQIKKEQRFFAIISLLLFGISFAMVMINTKEVMYGPDLRGTSTQTEGETG